MVNGAAGQATTDEVADQLLYPGHCDHPACQQWRWEALHDPLTGIANRRLLDDRLSQALRRRSRTGLPLTVLFIDLDGFRGVNGLHGHLVGDQVLAAVASTICREIRSFDTVARLGGDEFVIVLEGVARTEALDLAERLRRAIARPLSVTEAPQASTQVTVTASIGVVWARGDEGGQRVIHTADLAMYDAKRQGGNRCHFVDDGSPTLAEGWAVPSAQLGGQGMGELRQPAAALAGR